MSKKRTVGEFDLFANKYKTAGVVIQNNSVVKIKRASTKRKVVNKYKRKENDS